MITRMYYSETNAFCAAKIISTSETLPKIHKVIDNSDIMEMLNSTTGVYPTLNTDFAPEMLFLITLHRVSQILRIFAN